MRRVVVTGLGMVTPLACGVEETWSRLLAGQSGAGTITRFDSSNVVTQYACEIPMGDGSDGTFNPDDWMEPKEQRKVDDFIIYGMAAAVQAVRDAGWDDISEEEKLRTGVMIGSGIGGLNSIAETAVLIKEKGPKRVSPFFIPGALINLVSGQVSIRFGFKGPNHAVVTACSTGAHAIGDAARLSFLTGKTEEARSFANELLSLVPEFQANWNHDNAIHVSNIVLGRIALAEGRIDDAKNHLTTAGTIHGSPQLDTYGPDMSLANDLLAKGEQQVVLDYIELCRKFWSIDAGVLNRWKNDIENGTAPDFGDNLVN